MKLQKLLKTISVILLGCILLLTGALIGMKSEKEKLQQEEQAEVVTDIAIVNLDEGIYTDNKKVYYSTALIDLNADNLVPENLEAARQGINNGSYAAYILIPSDFSNNAVSINTVPQKSILEYAINPNLREDISRLTMSNIKNFEISLNTNMSYMYVQAILEEFHDVQDSAGTIMDNDRAELIRLLQIQPEYLMEKPEVAEIEGIRADIEDIDFNNMYENNRKISEELKDNYDSFAKQGQEDFKKIKDSELTVVEAMDLFYKTVSEIDVEKNEAGNIVYESGLQSLEKYLVEYEDKFAEQKKNVCQKTDVSGLPLPTPTAISTPVPTIKPTPRPTVTPRPTLTPRPTGTPTPEPTESPTPEGSPEVTESPTPEGSPEVTESPTPEGSPEVTESPTPEGSPEVTESPTPEGSPEATVNPTPEVYPGETEESDQNEVQMSRMKFGNITGFRLLAAENAEVKPTPEITPTPTPTPCMDSIPWVLRKSAEKKLLSVNQKIEIYNTENEEQMKNIRNMISDIKASLISLQEANENQEFCRNNYVEESDDGSGENREFYVVNPHDVVWEKSENLLIYLEELEVELGEIQKMNSISIDEIYDEELVVKEFKTLNEGVNNLTELNIQDYNSIFEEEVLQPLRDEALEENRKTTDAGKKFMETMEAYMEELTLFDLYKYYDYDKIDSLLAAFGENIFELEEKVYETHQGYEEYVYDAIDETNTEMELQQKSLAEAYEETTKNVQREVELAKQYRQAMNETNTGILSDFQAKLPYTRIGKLEYVQAYDFMVKPIEASDLSVSKKRTAILQDSDSLQNILIVVIVIWCMSICLLLFMKVCTVYKENQNKD